MPKQCIETYPYLAHNTAAINKLKQNMLSAMLDASASGFCLVNEHYQVLQFNRAAATLYEKITGVALYEGLCLLSLYAPERKEVVCQSIDAALRGEVTEYEVQYKQAQNAWIKVRYSPAYSADGSLAGVCIVNDDITLKKELEEKARLREMKFLSMFHFSAIGMALVSPEGVWLDVNPTLEKITGYSKAELVGGTFLQITHPDDLDVDLGFVQRMLAKEIETYQLEKRYRHKNGGIVWVLLTVSLVCHADGSPNFFISQVVDITATKALISELEAKNNTLDFAANDLEQKIQQLEDFTHMAGHNLRGPAGNISGLVALVRAASEQEMPGLLDMLQRAADGLLATLNELLQFSQVRLENHLVYEECDIKTLCEEALAEVAMRQDVAVRYNLAFTVLPYPRVYLRSIFYNLLSNAVKYRKPHVPLQITVTTNMAGDRRRLCVQDNGTGFDMARHKSILFKLNSTFHKGYNSKGIGLFITKTQIEKLGGTISVDSTIDEGTKFCIVF